MHLGDRIILDEYHQDKLVQHILKNKVDSIMNIDGESNCILHH